MNKNLISNSGDKIIGKSSFTLSFHSPLFYPLNYNQLSCATELKIGGIKWHQ